MKSRRHRFAVLLALGVGCAWSFARAGTPGPFPEAYPVERYAPLWEHSPFTIASVQQVAAQAGFAQNLSVVAIAKIGDEDMVTVLNKQSLERIVLSSDSDEQGIKLVGVSTDSDLLSTKVTIQKGGEIATIGFDRSQVGGAQPPASKATTAAAQITTAQNTAPQNSSNPSSDDTPPPHARQVPRLPPIPGLSPAATASLNKGATSPASTQ